MKRLFLPLLAALVACATHSNDDDGNVDESEHDFTIPGDYANVDASEKPPAAREMRALRYFVIPHPDDEVESWSLLEQGTDHYPVLMLLTRGEATRYCDGSGFDPGTGERAPAPQPFGQSTCPDERVDAWHFFLDEMAKSGRSHLGTVTWAGRFVGEVGPGETTPARCDGNSCRESRAFDAWVGERSARIVFDLGDGDLTKEEVIWAVRTVQRTRRLFPIQNEDDVVAAGYANKNPLFGLPYMHGDHLAIHHAIFETDLGLPGPQWGRTSFGDPDAALTLDVSGYAYDAMFHVDGERRVGAHTVAYGWLASPYYRGCENGYACPFSHHQKFWRRF